MANEAQGAITPGVVRHTALADAYSLLAYLLQKPTAQTAEQLSLTSIGDDVRQIAAEIGAEDALADAAAAFDGAYAEISASDDVLGLVRREHTRLFVQPRGPVIWPYEGVFVDSELVAAGKRSTDAVLFVNPAAADAQARYRAAGFDMNTNEVPADAITAELEFMGHLHQALAQALVQNDAAAAGSAGEALDGFVEARLSAWVPRFMERLAQEARVGLYRATGSLGAAIMGIEAPGK